MPGTIVIAGGSSDVHVSSYARYINELSDVPEPVDIANDSLALIVYNTDIPGNPKGSADVNQT
nr:hypothetical protein [Mycobacterium uberis]